ncbi:hypothetical protein V6N11_020469 [Hibiscus sabdariffa]|uniref:Uncharacterized protein n=1 Tax=Hibiscus sabdariffa TaxID=183260 RepID=A0ABR2Q8Y9_9ROSI
MGADKQLQALLVLLGFEPLPLYFPLRPQHANSGPIPTEERNAKSALTEMPRAKKEFFRTVTLRGHLHLMTRILTGGRFNIRVWGLGGKNAKEIQNSDKKRELFTEQRQKVHLKTFGSWEDSPEKMMMDDPDQGTLAHGLKST